MCRFSAFKSASVSVRQLVASVPDPAKDGSGLGESLQGQFGECCNLRDAQNGALGAWKSKSASVPPLTCSFSNVGISNVAGLRTPLGDNALLPPPPRYWHWLNHCKNR